MALFFNVVLEVHPLKAQEDGSDSLKVEVIPDSLLIGIKFYSNGAGPILSTLPDIKKPTLYGSKPAFDVTSISWDTLSTYKIKRTIHQRDLYKPTIVGFEEFTI